MAQVGRALSWKVAHACVCEACAVGCEVISSAGYGDYLRTRAPYLVIKLAPLGLLCIGSAQLWTSDFRGMEAVGPLRPEGMNYFDDCYQMDKV
jgi:hypothetical protein